MSHFAAQLSKKSLALLGASLALSVWIACGADEGQRRVVLITIDTLRADYVGCYGSERSHTPTFDGLARSGVRFETAISPTPMTRPSHASIMTALEPPLHGVHGNAKFKLAAEIPTLAEAFQAAGFETAAFVASLVLDQNSGLEKGFDHYDARMAYPPLEHGPNSSAERRADQVVDAALEWLEDAPERFFLWVHLYDPHADYQAPPDYAPKEKRAFPLEEQGFLRALSEYVPPDYAAEVSFSDAQTGRLLDAINDRFDSSGTWVALTSDHGESLGEHGELTHSLAVYDATQRVPLLLAGPELPGGVAIATPVRLVDLAPTLLALAEIAPLQNVSGRDLRGLIAGDTETPAEAAYLETLRPMLDYGWSPVYGLRTEQYKYLSSPTPELYDLARDPSELRNIASSEPELMRELDARLQEHFRDALPLRENTVLEAMDQLMLESLGYVSRSSEALTQELGWIGGPDIKQRLPAIVALTEANWHLERYRPERALVALEGSPPGSGWTANARSRAELALDRPERAEIFAREMIAQQPSYADGFIALGEALEALGKMNGAADAFDSAARLNPALSDPLLGLGRIAEAKGDPETAMNYYRQILDSQTPSSDASLRLAALHFDRKQPGRARAILAELGNTPGHRPAAIIRLAHAQTRAGFRRLALLRLKVSMRQGAGAPAVRATFRELRDQAQRAKGLE